jgi:hypothetical protein
VETRIAYSIVKELREPCSPRYRELEEPFNAAFQRLEAQASCWPFGGDERNRTADPLLAKQVLSHLSYIPKPTLQISDWNLRIETHNQ